MGEHPFSDRSHLTAGRLILPAICGLIWLVTISPLQAASALPASHPSLPDIHVHQDGFGKASQTDIAAVLHSAAGELWRHCPHTRLAAIDVYHRRDHPQIDFEGRRGGRIAIGLATQDTYWAQYSFQFAHEFCHALANYGNNHRTPRRHPRPANLWLEECLCETASLFALRAMSRSWQTSPPYPAWRSYAVWLNSYAEQRRIGPQKYRLPAGAPFIDWFRENQAALRQNPINRDRNMVIANQLLPIFESDPQGWGTLPYLNLGFANPEQSLAQQLAQWRSDCPKELRPFLKRLAALFAVRS